MFEGESRRSKRRPEKPPIAADCALRFAMDLLRIDSLFLRIFFSLLVSKVRRLLSCASVRANKSRHAIQSSAGAGNDARLYEDLDELSIHGHVSARGAVEVARA